jgi:hypothetical protein
VPASHRRVPAAVSVAALALALVVPASSLAQDATYEPAATPSAFCTVLTAAEASSALGVKLTVGTSSETDCSYDSDFVTSDVSLIAQREDGPISDDFPKSYYPDGVDIEVDGHTAYYDATYGPILFVDEGANDQLFVLQLYGTPPEEVDVQAALTSLASIGLPRLGSIPLPPEPSLEPEPSYLGDSELAALFPTEIAGSPVDVQTYAGADILASADPTDTMDQVRLQHLQKILTAQGKTMGDMSEAFGSFPTEDAFGYIIAVRIKGADIGELKDALLPLQLTDARDPQQTPTTIAGKDVFIVTDGPLDTSSPDPSADPYSVGSDRAYMYAKDDVLWFVAANEPELTEVFQKLP